MRLEQNLTFKFIATIHMSRISALKITNFMNLQASANMFLLITTLLLLRKENQLIYL